MRIVTEHKPPVLNTVRTAQLDFALIHFKTGLAIVKNKRLKICCLDMINSINFKLMTYPIAAILKMNRFVQLARMHAMPPTKFTYRVYMNPVSRTSPFKRLKRHLYTVLL